jgi:hypothetical protein
MNLSSLIDLPASAFNSSFPPPVLRKDPSIQNYPQQFIKQQLNKNKILIN